MPLFNYTYRIPYTENFMQAKIAELMAERFSNRCTREFRVPECGRISDVVIKAGGRIINIECKLTDVGGVVAQAKDHLKWVDYSLVCLPAELYIANHHKSKMIEAGIGLLLFKQPGILIEAIYPKWNSQKDWELRKVLEKRLGSEISAFNTVQGSLF